MLSLQSKNHDGTGTMFKNLDEWFIQQLLDLEREEPLSSSRTVDSKVELSEEKLQMIKEFFEEMDNKVN